LRTTVQFKKRFKKWAARRERRSRRMGIKGPRGGISFFP